MKPDPATLRAIIRRVLEESQAAASPRYAGGTPTDELFHSPEVEKLKMQIVDSGRRLWEREYVDGNGGNLSVRITDKHVLCTPTLCSKGELQPDELSVVDLENRQLAGALPRTSEILLHLQIYKAVPQARAVIHCHPPYATAHAIAGVVPPGQLIPELEVFVGSLALAPYETPGTQAFAETILPFVRQHNTILLANHGIVCWADTLTHARWLVEVVENYCKTVSIASQLRTPLQRIPPHKMAELLEIKRKLGLLTDFTVGTEGNRPAGDRRMPAAEPAPPAEAPPWSSARTRESVVQALTDEILRYLENSC